MKIVTFFFLLKVAIYLHCGEKARIFNLVQNIEILQKEKEKEKKIIKKKKSNSQPFSEEESQPESNNPNLKVIIYQLQYFYYQRNVVEPQQLKLNLSLSGRNHIQFV